MTASGNEMVRSGTSRLAKVGLRIAAYQACFARLSAEEAKALRAVVFSSSGFEGLHTENVERLTRYATVGEMTEAAEASGWALADEETDVLVPDERGVEAAGGTLLRRRMRRLRESELPLLPRVDDDGMLRVRESFSAEAIGTGILELGRCLGTPMKQMRAWGLRKFAAENVVRCAGARLACRFLQHRDTEGASLNRVYRNSLNNLAAGGFVTGREGAGEAITPVSVLVFARVPETARVRHFTDLPVDAPERVEVRASDELAVLQTALDGVEAQLDGHIDESRDVRGEGEKRRPARGDQRCELDKRRALACA